MPENNVTHLGDGLYATFDGYGIALSVNDHRNPPVAYIDGPSSMAALIRFWEQQTALQVAA